MRNLILISILVTSVFTVSKSQPYNMEVASDYYNYIIDEYTKVNDAIKLYSKSLQENDAKACKTNLAAFKKQVEESSTKIKNMRSFQGFTDYRNVMVELLDLYISVSNKEFAEINSIIESGKGLTDTKLLELLTNITDREDVAEKKLETVQAEFRKRFNVVLEGENTTTNTSIDGSSMPVSTSFKNLYFGTTTSSTNTNDYSVINTNITAKEYVTNFLKDMIADKNEKMKGYISPSYIKLKNLNMSVYKVNSYSPVDFSVDDYNSSTGIVTTRIWGSNKGWMHRIKFKVVTEGGKFYLYPSRNSDAYIDPWDSVDSYIKE